MLLAFFGIRRFDYCVSFDLVSWLAQNKWLHVSGTNALENCLVDEVGWSDFSLKSGVSVTNCVNMIKLLVEHLMHLDRVVFEFVDLQDSLCETNCMLEA